MTALARRRLSLGAGAFLAALLGAILVAQYLRSGWPFAPRAREAAISDEATDPHAGHAPPPAGAGAPAAATEAHAGHAAPDPRAGAPPEGYAPVTVDPSRAAAMQLTTAPVEERELQRTVRTVGVVTLDERRSAHVHAKVRGWIQEIHVDFVGRQVKAGEPLCSIYSQEVYSAEIELVSLLGRASAQAGPDPLLQAARRRLALWDVPKSELDRLERTREPRGTFPLLAPGAGTVVAKQAIHGMFVDPSLELYTLSDLSRLWVLVDLYEADVPYVRVGDRARLRVEGEPAPLEGTVAFLSPTLDEATRTRKVRFEVENRSGRLLPGSFASAELELSMGRGLAVPESAVIRTGTRSIVFVVHGGGEHVEPREVRIGPLVGDSYRVEAGLRPGERVATGAQFLLDSESRLRATSGPGAGHAH